MTELKIKNEYEEIFNSFEQLVVFILTIFQTQNTVSVKDNIIRSLIAKSFSLYKSIYILVKNKQEAEAMSLYRILIERYFYLIHLNKTGSFQEFSDWSFIDTHEMRNKMRSCPDFNNNSLKNQLKDTQEDIKKYEKLKGEKNRWSEPKIECIAKESNNKYLYDFGYDLASTFIHPRATEGYLDELRIIEGVVDGEKLEQIIHNSTVVFVGVFYQGISNTNVNWGKYILNYIDCILYFLLGKSKLNIFGYENLIKEEILLIVNTKKL